MEESAVELVETHNYHELTLNKIVNIFDVHNGNAYLVNDYANERVFNDIDISLLNNEFRMKTLVPNHRSIEFRIKDIDGMKSYDELFTDLKNALKKGETIPVARNYLMLELNYTIEVLETGQIVRVYSERIPIRNLAHFIAKGIDLPIDWRVYTLTQYQGAFVSQVDDYVHGPMTLICRIKNVRMYLHTVKDTVTDDALHNRYYHFTTDCKHIIVSHEMVNHTTDIQTNLVLLKQIDYDKSFVVSTNDRISFMFTVWRSGMIAIPDTKDVYDILNGNVLPPEVTIDDILNRLNRNETALNYFELRLDKISNTMDVTNEILKSLIEQVKRLSETVSGTLPPSPPSHNHCHCGHNPCTCGRGAPCDFRVDSTNINIFDD